jgi:hypothetical protein
MSDSSKYGRFYWCAKVSKDVSTDGEIYVMADDVEIDEGALRFVQYREENETKTERVNLLIPPGKWLAVYAASVVDGSAVAVEHWAGEILDPLTRVAATRKMPGRRHPRRREREFPKPCGTGSWNVTASSAGAALRVRRRTA